MPLISFPSRTPTGVPAPETRHERFGFLFRFPFHPAVFAGVFLLLIHQLFFKIVMKASQGVRNAISVLWFADA
jgi:hypothetical protein